MVKQKIKGLSRFATVLLVVSCWSPLSRADKMYGLFMVVKGTVQVQSGAGAPADVKVGSKIFEGDTVISGADSRAKIVMSDRNTINISPDTKLQIEKYANDAASGQKTVQLNLVEGKVRNNVEQTYDGAKSTFQIKSPTAVAGVRGTQFLASYSSATQITSIVAFKGAVTLASINPAGQVIGKPVLITKGHSSQTSPNQPALAPAPVPKESIKKMDGESSVSLKSTSGTSSSVSSSSLSGSQPGPASVGGPNPAGAPPTGGGSMIDSRDLDLGMAKGINAANVASAPPPPPGLLGAPPPPPPNNTLVQGVLNNTAGKTTLIVTPSPR
jgi:hypothetical protein